MLRVEILRMRRAAAIGKLSAQSEMILPAMPSVTPAYGACDTPEGPEGVGWRLGVCG